MPKRKEGRGLLLLRGARELCVEEAQAGRQAVGREEAVRLTWREPSER